MSAWDEKAQVAAERLTAQARMPKVTAEYVEPILVEMALLQREALLSDESVERAARELFYGDIDPDLDVTWATAHEGVRAEYLAMARNALAAALGEDESNE